MSAEEGLELLRSEGPFAVIISDQRMGRMDGIDFLTEVRQLAPDSARMMLTGNVSLQLAIDAINDAGAFRFLVKPCEHDVLVAAIEDGLVHYAESVNGTDPEQARVA